MTFIPLHEISISPNDNPANHAYPTLILKNNLWQGSFQAMASDCQILMEGVDQPSAARLLRVAAIETWRIEAKFSRYRTDNVMYKINHAYSHPMDVDDETIALLNFADQCYQLSEGLFDVTAGVLRKIWRFDGSDKIPTQAQIDTILPLIGWHKVSWNPPRIQLLPDMELDLGGIGKEYAVDKVCQALHVESHAGENARFLVNFGGDLACSGPRLDGKPWDVAVESYQYNEKAIMNVHLHQGGIATSGDSRRYLLKDGIRYSHILNPLNGHSITDAPHSVSVAASSCMQAGILSTMAMLQGQHAEAFLTAQDADYWVQR